MVSRASRMASLTRFHAGMISQFCLVVVVQLFFLVVVLFLMSCVVPGCRKPRPSIHFVMMWCISIMFPLLSMRGLWVSWP